MENLLSSDPYFLFADFDSYLDAQKEKKDTDDLIKNILTAGVAILGVIGLAAFLGKQGGDIG